MARVNVEDSLWTDGQISKLARTMKWDEREALGALVMVYRYTQKAGIVSAQPSRLVTTVVLAFDSDGQAEAFLWAMVSAHLAAVLTDGQIKIRGNEKHVERLDRLQSTASKAGKASAAVRQKKANDFVTGGQPGGNLQGTENQPVGNAPILPFSHSPIQETNTKSNTIPKTPKTPSAPSATPTGYTEAVALWFAAYEKRYKAKPTWGAVYGKQLQAIMRKAPIDELRELIPAFFAWMRPEVIKAGHSLSTGYASFAMKLDELRADLLDPSRRAFAAQVQAREKLGEQIATDDDQVNRINALMAREVELERTTQQGRALESAHGTATQPALGRNSEPVRRIGDENQRPDDAVLVQSARPVRDRVGSLSSAGSLLRGGSAPERGQGQNGDARPARAGADKATTTAD